jgi:hypothetical protein
MAECFACTSHIMPESADQVNAARPVFEVILLPLSRREAAAARLWQNPTQFNTGVDRRRECLPLKQISAIMTLLQPNVTVFA